MLFNKIFKIILIFTILISSFIISIACLNFRFHITGDTVIQVLGNVLIAYYITNLITKKQKTEELNINRCFIELDNLTQLTNDIRNILDKKLNINDDFKQILRLFSLLSLQIELIKKYTFISEESKNNLGSFYNTLNDMVTGDELNEEYDLILLKIEQKVLVIKSSILK